MWNLLRNGREIEVVNVWCLGRNCLRITAGFGQESSQQAGGDGCSCLTRLSQGYPEELWRYDPEIAAERLEEGYGIGTPSA